MKRLGHFLLLSSSVLIAACDLFEGSSLSEVTVAYDQHIKPIIDRKCGSCHVVNGIGPFSLTTYEEVVEKAKASLASIESGRMPPWAAKRDCRDYYGDFSLTNQEKDMFNAWVKSGMTRSLAQASTYEPAPFDALTLSRIDVVLKNSEPYQPSPNPDETRCFVIDWPYQETKYIVGNEVMPSDLTLAHHSSVYIAPASDRDFYRARDAANGTPTDGYPCSATMGVGKSSARWIGGWLPGLTGFEFPLNAGMLIEPNSVVILQVHYNKQSHSGDVHDSVTSHAIPPDQTEIRLKIADQVDLVGTLVTFTNPNWMVEKEMDIPMNKEMVAHEFSGRVDLIPKLIGQTFPLGGDEFDIQSVNMHGHALMTGALMKVIRQDQSEECLLDIDHFSSHWQLNYMFKQPVKVTTNDKVYIRCVWNNSPENQMVVDGSRMPSINVNWGDGARDEMCFGLMFVTEHKK